jgi:uncharacterized protein YkwD
MPRPLTRLMVLIVGILSATALVAAPSAGASASSAQAKQQRSPRKQAPRRARAASGCANANAPVGSTSFQALRSAVVCLINQQRTSRHLPALGASSLLNHSAQGWTNAMVSSGQFTHGTNFASRITAAGFTWRSAGENIATGFPTPRSVVSGWMGSTGHCQNILNPTYRSVGTGVSKRVVRGWATGAGTWTQDFALGLRQSAPSGNFAPMNRCPF